MPKVSVIVPVYNPGHNIEDCIRSLLGQTLPAAHLELIFVDDGSTDATPARLDALAAEHRHVRVEHIPNSGWPGRPRNVGIDLARGEYVYFVDNDDWLGEEALERLYGTAVADDADIVIGKVVGEGGRKAPRALFRQNLHGVPFDSPALLGLLTPHKLFRRAFVAEHGLRFPEGRRRLEDHLFVVEAYFQARRISVVADYPCYHWVLRGDDTNASHREFDAEGYFDNVREVLDLVERHTEPGPFRDDLLLHWYRGKMLGRVGGVGYPNRTPERRRELYETVRALTLDRFPERVDPDLPFHLRLRSRLLRDGRPEALLALAEFEAELGASIRLRPVRGDGTHLLVTLQAKLAPKTLRFRQDGDRVLWEPPESLREALAGENLDVTRALRRSNVLLFLHSLEDESEFVVPAKTDVALEPGPEPGLVRPVLTTTATITPTTAAAGAPLAVGPWEIRAGVTVAGFYSARIVRHRKTKTPLVVTAHPPGRIVEGHKLPPEALAGRARIVRRVGRLRRTLRRTRARVAAVVRG